MGNILLCRLLQVSLLATAVRHLCYLLGIALESLNFKFFKSGTSLEQYLNKKTILSGYRSFFYFVHLFFFETGRNSSSWYQTSVWCKIKGLLLKNNVINFYLFCWESKIFLLVVITSSVAWNDFEIIFFLTFVNYNNIYFLFSLLVIQPFRLFPVLLLADLNTLSVSPR